MDLLSGELASDAFRLPWTFMIPDVILFELRLPYSWNLQGQGLVEAELSEVGVQKVEELVKKYPKHPGRLDLFALVLAIQESAVLLTGDGALRKAASNEGVEHHGTLWLLDAMVEEGTISGAKGCTSLELMLHAGRRLPKKDVLARMAAWKPP
ncbi:MAG: hypothetical protein MUE87_04690 [Methanothrix sp.]|nr:hypothetical protein [Methanothrix sp.]